MNGNGMSKIVLESLLAALLTGLGSPVLHAQAPQAYTLSGEYEGTHDPAIAKEGNTYYVFATGKTKMGGQFTIRCSHDLKQWAICGQVFDQIPDWIKKESPGTEELWAPDISYYNGQYRLYYAYSLFGKNTSGIALATNKTLDPKSPDYKWEDQGLVLRSTERDDFNAIDPNFIVDRSGRTWLAFGSFWSGIKMKELDPRTGKPKTSDARLYALAARAKPASAGPVKPGLPPDWQAVEAPFVVYHNGYYYLFVSWDLSNRPVFGSIWKDNVRRWRFGITDCKPKMARSGWGVGSHTTKWAGYCGLSRLCGYRWQTGITGFDDFLG
jgi:arabinan endo-1,5-alpha-L-arabinosidase